MQFCSMQQTRGGAPHGLVYDGARVGQGRQIFVANACGSSRAISGRAAVAAAMAPFEAGALAGGLSAMLLRADAHGLGSCAGIV